MKVHQDDEKIQEPLNANAICVLFSDVKKGHEIEYTYVVVYGTRSL